MVPLYKVLLALLAQPAPPGKSWQMKGTNLIERKRGGAAAAADGMLRWTLEKFHNITELWITSGSFFLLPTTDHVAAAPPFVHQSTLFMLSSSFHGPWKKDPDREAVKNALPGWKMTRRPAVNWTMHAVDIVYHRLGSVAGPVIQATGRSEFEVAWSYNADQIPKPTA
jgi:hypothetical protein